MSDPADSNTAQLQDFCQTIAQQAKDASQKLALSDSRAKDQWLRACAATFETQVDEILQANQEDYQSAQSAGLSAANLDRLQLNRQRVLGIASALRAIADLPDPVGEIIEGYRRPSGIEVRKVRVPIGVIFFIYEARPNVTSDAAAICVKSGNAVILRCGKEAIRTSSMMAGLMVEQLEAAGLPRHAIQMIETPDRTVIDTLLARPQEIDLAIPRGGEGLIRRVCDLAKMPVLKHFDGNCHVYVDASADLKMAVDLVVNAKCQRMGVCNACESFLLFCRCWLAQWSHLRLRYAATRKSVAFCPKRSAPRRKTGIGSIWDPASVSARWIRSKKRLPISTTTVHTTPMRLSLPAWRRLGNSLKKSIPRPS
jgi:glutamate-5-semialdehyde dehydrogenase